MKASPLVVTLLLTVAAAANAGASHDRPIMSLERQYGAGLLAEEMARTGTDAAKPALDADGEWTHLSIAGRFGHTAIYDAVRERMIVFGGVDSFNDLNDLWSLSLSNPSPWEALETAGDAPPAGLGYSAIYDAPRRRMVVAGRGNAWSLSLHGKPRWVDLNPTGAPPEFGGPALYDPVRDRLLILDEYENKLWALSLTGTPSWTVQTPTGTPPVARWGAVTVYDSLRDRLVMLGGEGDTYPLPTDVWALSLSGTPAWAELVVTGTPFAGRFDATAIYDPIRDRVVVNGGSDGSIIFYDSWAVSLSGSPSWSRLETPAATPRERFLHTSVYDAPRDRMVIFGGEEDQQPHERNDVWALSLAGAPQWSPVPGTSPEPRALHSAVHVPAGNRMIVFGGRRFQGALSGSNDTWSLSLDKEPFWSQLQTLGTPPPGRYLHTAVYDPPRHRMLVFGGTAEDGLWTLLLGGQPAWTHKSPSGTPPPNYANAIYDPRRDRMLVFSGAGSSVWSLSLETTPHWTILAPSGVPPSQTGAGMYDPARDRIIIFGDSNTSAVWSLSLSGNLQWAQLATSGAAPAPRSRQTVIYDEAHDRMVLFGGQDSAENYPLDDTWELSLGANPAWLQLSPSGFAGLPRAGHTAIYDARHDRMVIFGGEDFYVQFNDVRALTWGKRKGPASEPNVVVEGELKPGYPNPFNPSVTIPFELQSDGDVTLSIFDVSGGLVKTLLDEWTERGAHEATWDGTGTAGEPVSSGIYFCELRANGFSGTRKLVLLK